MKTIYRMATYAEKLENPLWQKKRLEIMERDKFTCQICGDKETLLHVHHKQYKLTLFNPWEYETWELITLCKHCHYIVEEIKVNLYLDTISILKTKTSNTYFVFAIVKTGLRIYKGTNQLDLIVKLDNQNLKSLHHLTINYWLQNIG